jgi:NAD(P)-dependent dehydrogenase (short-subunit alcohol dehydrogenase family)
MSSPLAGRGALVTGAGRGIGRAVALALAAAGADVVLTSRTGAELDHTLTLVEEAGGRGWAVPADVTDRDDVLRLRAAAAGAVDSIDIVVNNAGNLVIAPFVPLPTSGAGIPSRMDAALTFEQWRSVHAVHLDGAFHVLQAFGPAMVERGYGRVVNIVSSTLGRTSPFTSAYDTAKAGLAQLTRSLAFEWARHGVTVNAIAVGQIRTDMTAQGHDDPAVAAWMTKRIPMRRTGEPEEVGRLVAMLADPGSAFLTGQVIGLDGGETL